MPHEIVFDDYSKDELFSIAKTMFEDEKYVLSEKALTRLKSTIWSRPISGNARGVRNLVFHLFTFFCIFYCLHFFFSYCYFTLNFSFRLFHFSLFVYSFVFSFIRDTYHIRSQKLFVIKIFDLAK